jgi:hypothetical protein
MSKQEHWATSSIPGVVLAAILFVAISGTHACHSRQDVRPAAFRTTDLIVDNATALGNATTLVNEAFAAPASSQNDFDPWSGGPHTSRLEVDTTAAASPFRITGLVAGNDGDLLYIWNGGGGADVPFTFTDSDLASSPLNRFHLPYAGPYTLNFQGGALFIYLGGFGWSLLQGDGGNLMPTQLTLTPTRPAALANGSTTNNYNPWGSGGLITPTVYQDTGAASTVTGLVAPNVGTTSFGGGNDGATLEFVNTSSTGTTTITCNDGGSLPENQVRCSASIVLTPFSSVGLIYDTTGSGGWRVKSLALSP